MHSIIICDCGEVIVKSQNNMEKMRAKIILIKEGKVFAVCKNCNKEIFIPILKKSVGPRLILKK